MLYRLEHDTQKKFNYANMDVTLIKYNRSICAECNRQVAVPEYSSETPCLRLEGGSVYPDFLQFCGAGRQLFLVSEKTLELCELNAISGYSVYQKVCVELTGRKKEYTVPNYYNLDIEGRIELDMAAMYLRKKRRCSACGQFEWNRKRFEPLILNHTSWDGSDLCAIESIPGFRVCSEKMKELVLRHNLSGFSFRKA